MNRDEFSKLLKKPEGLKIEFKEAKNQISRDNDLPDYCAALANEGGGKLILGVNNSGVVVGTVAFGGTYNQLSNELLKKLGIRVDVEELHYDDKRILVFHVPERPFIGRPVKSTGKYTYPMRAGESLVEMDEQTLRKILNEGEPDFSNRIVPSFAMQDVDLEALNNFKVRWAEKAARKDYLEFPPERILRSIGILTDQGLSYAGLILFGKKEIIDRLIPCNEIIFEWRGDAAKTQHDFRVAWREPIFKILDEIWKVINARNLRIPFQEGLFQREIFAFNEKAVREALLNAVTHRDYSVNGRSIFIKASPQEFFIESPGGFPLGITLENILEKSYWRNRCIAEVFEKAELVERAGQGMNDIFESAIREGKGMPNFSGSDAYSVVLRIPAQVRDKDFILFLERVAKEKQIIFSFDEIYELEKIREQQTIDKVKNKVKFIKMGIIEKIGKTNDSKYILSHKYYVFEGKLGTYTRLKGVSRDKRKELILTHLSKNGEGRLSEFKDIFPELKAMDISNLLRELKNDGKIVHKGKPTDGYWRLP